MLIEKTIIGAFIATVCIQFAYWGYYFLLNKKKKINQDFDEGITVIICAHNELENIKSFLHKFLSQDYIAFEVILVNDRSTDDTLYYINSLKNTKLKSINIANTPTNWNNKKWALSQAAKIAKYDYLLFSDADCYPNSNQWITEMSKGFTQGEAVLGYSGYQVKNTFLNKFIQYETYITAVSYLGLSDKNIPYMAVGRNFGIKKDLYTKFNFGDFKHLQGGDDDLIINHIKPSITTVFTPTSHTISIPKNRLKDYVRQKTRHINISNHYSVKTKIIIGLFNLSSLLFYLLFILTYQINILIYYAIGLFVLRTSVLFYNFTIGSNELNTEFKSFHLIWLDFVYTFFLWTIGPIALLAKKIKWK